MKIIHRTREVEGKSQDDRHAGGHKEVLNEMEQVAKFRKAVDQQAGLV